MLQWSWKNPTTRKHENAERQKIPPTPSENAKSPLQWKKTTDRKTRHRALILKGCLTRNQHFHFFTLNEKLNFGASASGCTASKHCKTHMKKRFCNPKPMSVSEHLFFFVRSFWRDVSRKMKIFTFWKVVFDGYSPSIRQNIDVTRRHFELPGGPRRTPTSTQNQRKSLIFIGG